MVTTPISTLKREHQIFVEQMIAHGNATQAYMKAYPKSSESSARVKSYTLLKNVTIVTEINEAVTRMKQKVEAVIIQGAIEGVEKHIRSKHERILILQNQIELSLQELQTNIGEGYYLQKKKVVEYKRPLSPFERSTIRKTIRELQAEISKIEGDYAPIKTASTKPDGSPVDALPPTLNITVIQNTAIAITESEAL